MANSDRGNGHDGNGQVPGQPPGDQAEQAGAGTEAFAGAARAPRLTPRPSSGVRRVNPPSSRPESVPDLAEQLFQQGVGKRIAPPDDDEVRITCPGLWNLLTTDRYANGKDRYLAEIVIRRTSGAYTAVLKDHERAEQKEATSLTLLGVAEALEKALWDPCIPWKPFTSYVNKKGLARHDEKKT